MGSLRRRLWVVVPAILALVALLHPVWVGVLGLSPWIGAGFGMFATVDGDDRVILVDGGLQSDPELTNAPFGPRWQRFESQAQNDGQPVEILVPAFDPDSDRVIWESLRR